MNTNGNHLEKELTPRRIVEELDKYIIGQNSAKKCAAIAVRNRWRRLQLAPELRDEVAPKNIIMIGPTGVGKTEIAKRLAALVKAPFLKVEASRYTEVGYHGRDVESMVRDLVEIAHNMIKAEAMKTVQEKADAFAEERLLDLLLPSRGKTANLPAGQDAGILQEPSEATVEKLREKLRKGELDDRHVELALEEKIIPMMQVMSTGGIEEFGFDIQSALGNMFPSKSISKKMLISEARKIITQQEAEKLIDRDKVVKEAIFRATNSGIIFIDEIDKVAAKEGSHGPDVSREGVQRDMLPIVEGSTVMTRYGPVKTNHILFIAAGAFHISKPTDLIPELQGRFPIRVELSSLGKDDFIRILTEPKNALIRQYQALVETEGVKIKFNKEAIEEMADIAAKANSTMQNIGARRLHTVIEKVLEDVSYEAPDMKTKTVNVTREYVREKLQSIVKDEDLSKYIL